MFVFVFVCVYFCPKSSLSNPLLLLPSSLFLTSAPIHHPESLICETEAARSCLALQTAQLAVNTQGGVSHLKQYREGLQEIWWRRRWLRGWARIKERAATYCIKMYRNYVIYIVGHHARLQSTTTKMYFSYYLSLEVIKGKQVFYRNDQ